MTKSRGILKPRRNWTDAEVEILRTRYPHEKSEAIAADLGRSLQQVYQKAAHLHLVKTPEYLAGPDACRLRKGDNVGAEFRFKKGSVPANKGKPMPSTGRSAETQFKPGQPSHTTLPIGSYRLAPDGSLQRKINNNPGSNSVRWRGVHELVWIEANGPVPPKHIVVFKPGCRTTDADKITIDQVECISLADHMRRHTRHNLPKELSDLIGLRGALNRQINKRTKHHEQ